MIEVKVLGIPDFVEALRSIPAKLRRRALGDALRAGGRLVRDEAKKNTPVLNPAHPAVLAGKRRPGTVKRALAVRVSKFARRSGDVGVYINVRPSKIKGANVPTDPFYWRFIEFGTRRGTPRHEFLSDSAGAFPQALSAITARIAPAIAKLNAPARVQR